MAGPPVPDPRRFVMEVASDTDVYAARTRMRSLATQVGFDRIAASELTIAVSELAWNIVKHAGGGCIEIGCGTHPVHGVFVSVAARDHGPPFRDFNQALRDGHDDAGPLDPMSLLHRRGIGGGLGAVQRFTHELRHQQEPDGKCVLAVRYLRPPFPNKPAP